ncbi:MAG TPA: endonuclease/exonuclease/phosphatase family protein [Chitinophagaceae bacterium]|jgi:endonuclease/exonuclease/phosphatase family metal-dependent hydrolase
MAKSLIRRFAKWFFISLNILVCIVFLLACLSPFLNSSKWPFISFLALGIPYLAVLLIFLTIFWLIIKPVRALISIVTLLIGWKQLTVICAWHTSRTFNNENKNDSVLRVITWNVRGMYGLSKNSYTQIRDRSEIGELVSRLNPDIVCLQEFNNSTYKNSPYANNIGLFTGKCPYYFFSKDIKNSNGRYYAGSILFSKFPIVDSGKIKFPGTSAESLIYADIVKDKDTIRIFTTHLQSFQFTQSDYAQMEKIKDPDRQAIQASENIYSKMKLAYRSRGVQTDMVRKATDKCSHASIVCGDFNDVPNSYTYFKIRGNRQDAFLASSFGVGRTYNALAPTLRIDYILPDDRFNILQFDLIDEGLSDHHLLVSDVSLKK